MKYFLACLFSMSIAIAFGKKDTVVTYYGYQMNEIEKKEYCVYYRKTFIKADSTYGFLQYYNSGTLHMTGTLEMESLNKTGLFVYYSNKGVKIKEENYLADLREGDYKTWYMDGTPESEGSYQKDKQSGVWKYWYVDGSLQTQGTYVVGEKEGEWKVWYRGDKIASIGNYKAGKKDGAWKSWFKSGAVDQEGVYREDKRDGDWVFYFESGKTSAKETYENGVTTKVEFWDESGNSVEPTEILEKDPEFPGGELAMMKFIQKNIFYPEDSREMGEQGTIYISFTVGTDGKLYDINVLKGVSPLLDSEALRVIKKMPDWIPGFSHNRVMEIYYVIPITFTIQ